MRLIRAFPVIFFLVFLGAAPVYKTPAGDSEELLARARQARGPAMKYASQHGAEIIPTPDGRSFYVSWFPQAALGNGKSVIVTLHGRGSWALDEFRRWHKAADEAGVGIIALQWWFGGGEGVLDYYTPDEMYPVIESALAGARVPRGHALLHGFSRGASNLYALAALDAKEGNGYFGLFAANAGGFTRGYPPNEDIASGRLGEKIYGGSHWVLYCGGKDPHPDRDGCEAMVRTKNVIEKLGGAVDLFIQDPEAGHGGFHQNPLHVESALELFRSLVRDGLEDHGRSAAGVR